MAGAITNLVVVLGAADSTLRPFDRADAELAHQAPDRLAVVALAPLLATRRLVRMDIPATLRVLE